MHKGKLIGVFITAALLVSSPRVVSAQAPCQDCDCIMARAAAAADSANFQLALRQYDAAKLCDTALTDPVNRAIVNLFVRINKLRLDAEEKERIANEALRDRRIAEGKMIEAQDSLRDALDSAEVARNNAVAARLKAEAAEQEANQQARIARSRLTVNEINKLLLDKRHHEALERVELAKRDSLGAAGDTIVNSAIENFRRAGERLLWRMRKGDIQLKNNRGICLSPMLAIVAVDSSGRAHIISNATGRSLFTFNTDSTYLGGAFSKNGTSLALYTDRIVRQWDVSTTNDTSVITYPFQYTNRQTFEDENADIRGVRFNDNDFLYVLKDTALFAFSEPGVPIYTTRQKIVDLESSIVLPEGKRVRKDLLYQKVIITLEGMSRDSDGREKNKKMLVLFRKTQKGGYQVREQVVEVRNYRGAPAYFPRKLLFGPNQRFLISNEGDYIDFRSRKMARFRPEYVAVPGKSSGRGALYYDRDQPVADDFRVFPALDRTLFRRQNVLTVRTLEGWKETTLEHAKGDTIQGFDIIPKERNISSWSLSAEEVPEKFFLLTYTNTGLSIWDWKSGNLISQAGISSGRIRDVIVSVDGRYILLTTEQDRMELWRVGTYGDIKDRNVIIAVTEEPENE